MRRHAGACGVCNSVRWSGRARRTKAYKPLPKVSMDQATHNKIVSFLWGIADDVLRDLFKRGKYPDVILPMCVIRRMDAVLEPTKRAVLDTKKT